MYVMYVVYTHAQSCPAPQPALPSRRTLFGRS